MEINEHMEVIGADGVHVWTRSEGGRIKLTKKDSGEGSHKGHHHFIAKSLVAGIEGNKVRLSANADVAVTNGVARRRGKIPLPAKTLFYRPRRAQLAPRGARRVRMGKRSRDRAPTKKENARGERAFSVVDLGVVGVVYYPRGDFGGMLKSRVNSLNFVSVPSMSPRW